MNERLIVLQTYPKSPMHHVVCEQFLGYEIFTKEENRQVSNTSACSFFNVQYLNPFLCSFMRKYLLTGHFFNNFINTIRLVVEQ